MRIWLVDQNPLNLPEPPQWWQDLVSGYDKMLRIMPSQKEHVYRLGRVVRREARLGLQTMVVHDHPDTRAMIKFGCVPIAPVYPWAIHSTAIIRDLRARDTWVNGGANKVVDMLEAAEKKTRDYDQAQADADIDERSASAFRAVKYGRPVQVDYGHRRDARREFRELFRDDVKPLATLPSLKPLASELQNRVPSEPSTPPAGSPAARTSPIILTDL